ncbi:hypothetical protein HDV01_003377 [Terramyces sp. JEL0728]|nr:hypothetical protein HDV01_003377 [Terramyces sp. JEL0728]
MFKADIQEHISREETIRLAERAAIQIDSIERFAKDINEFASMVSHVEEVDTEPMNSLVSKINQKNPQDLACSGPTFDSQSLSKLSISDGYFIAK